MTSLRKQAAFALVPLALLVAQAWGGVSITEFMAVNDTVLEDEDGDYTDWIEIHNDAATPVSLAGWSLTDKATKPQKWPFPSMTIGAHERIVVFASGKDRRNQRSELHTNFSLSGGGEYLALVQPDGTVVQEFAPEYPAQAPDIAYGTVDSLGTVLLARGAPASAHSPATEAEFLTDFPGWNTDLGYPASGWQSGHTGIGYDRNGGYGSLLGAGGNVEALTYQQNDSIFVRVPFSVTDTTMTRLTLRMKFDDGFRAFLNGTPVAEDAAPSPAGWNASASFNRDESQNEHWTLFDLTPYIPLLTNGVNLLAFQGFNIQQRSSDLLVLPELEAAYDSVIVSSYLHEATPGEDNGPGTVDLGPVIRDTTDQPPRPHGGAGAPSMVITSRVVATLRPIQSVHLRYRHMFNGETTVAMTPLGDDLYTASIPVAGVGSGQMIRWRVEAADDEGYATTDPLYLVTSDNDQYYGTSTLDSSYADSLLPVVEWFVEDPVAAETTGGSRCSIYYLGRFYDNVEIRRHGQSSGGFVKKSFNLDFNKDNRFLYREGERKVKDLKWMTNWGDKTKLHNTMTHETAERVGAAYLFTFPVRLQKNGVFDRVTEMMEDGDDRWLERLGLDPEGALYKMYNGLQSASGEKKTRRYEGNTDLAGLVNGLDPADPIDSRRFYAYDNMNIPQCISYMVAANLASHQDHGHKNYYVYRDTNGTGEWSIFLWDVDLTWGRNWLDSAGYFTDTLYANNSLTFETAVQNKEYNRLYRVFHYAPELREMYLRRLRTCMDEILQSPETPVQDRLLEARFDYWIDLLDPPGIYYSDARLDRIEWGRWGTGQSARQEVDRTKSAYLSGRREYLFNSIPSAPRVQGEHIPAGQPVDAAVRFETVDFLPASGNAMQEYFTLINTNDYAVDISGWSVTGAVEHVFRPGTVIPSGGGVTEHIGRLFVARQASAFRARSGGPSGGQFCMVQDGYRGQLSARGETLHLLTPNGREVDQLTYLGRPTPAQQYLRISELMYAPTAPTAAELASDPYLLASDFEFIELVNTGPTPMDLGGAEFTEGVLFTFPGGFTLPAYGYAIVTANTNAFPLRYGGTADLAGQFDGHLDNNGDTLRLLDSAGEKVLEFTYNDAWYPISRGLDFSLVVHDENADWASWGDASSWRVSENVHGSPGAADPPATPLSGILVNEALTHTDLPQVDSVELHNPEGQDANIGGWFLSDDLYTPRKFRVPDDTMLPAGGYIVFDETDFNADTNAPASFQLSSTGDAIRLFSADSQSNLTGYLHGFEFGAARNGVSFGRYVTTVGEEHFPAQSALTLGWDNAGPAVGPVVISKIMYHPSNLGGTNNIRDEFIELTNVSTNDVPLYDPAAATNTWRLRKAVDFNFPQGAMLPAGARILVVGFDPLDTDTLAAFRAAYGLGVGVPVYGPWSGSLNNAGETVALEWPDSPNLDIVPYVLAEEVGYQSAEPWPPAADGTGHSLQRIFCDLYGNDPDNWYAASPRPGQAPDLEHDGDGDGMEGWAEWKARTDPDDPNSYMYMEGAAIMSSGSVEFHLRTVAGRRYAVETTSDLAEEPFYPVEEGIKATGDMTVVTITNVLDSADYYRMRLDP